MNLFALASPVVSIVNSPVVGRLVRHTGYTTAANGKRTPSYASPETLAMQVQALSGPELALVEGLNIQGVKRAVHLPGDVRGVDRQNGTGGDLITFGTAGNIPAGLRGTTWLVTIVLETWDSAGWCRVAITKQVNAA